MSKITKGKWSVFPMPIVRQTQGGVKFEGHNPDVWILKSEIDHDPSTGITRTTIHFGEIQRCGDMSDEELEANARAIAALPDLIEAAEPIVEIYDNANSRTTVSGQDTVIVQASFVAALRSALLKAKGEAGQ